MNHLGMPIIWIGLAITGIIIYFSQIATRLAFPQAMIGLIFFSVTTLDIPFNKISFRSINARFNAKKVTRKLMLPVSILIIVAIVSFVAGWPNAGNNAFVRPLHHHVHDEMAGERPWTFFVIHSIANILGI
jgi:hypothetical protein